MSWLRIEPRIELLSAHCYSLTTALPGDRSPIRCSAAMIAQRHIHKNVSAGSLETHHQGLGVFTPLASLLRGVQRRRPHVKVKTLVVERGDGVADNLIGKLADGLAYEFVVGLGDRH